MFSPDMLKGLLPELVKMLNKDGGNPVSDIEAFLTEWFRQKKLTITLADNEHRLVLMFNETKGNLLMVPVTLDETDPAHPKVVRFLVDHGINVSQFAQQLKIEDAVSLAMVPEADPVKNYQRILAIFRKAANKRECRLQQRPKVQQLPVAPAPHPAIEHTEGPLPDGVDHDLDDEEFEDGPELYPAHIHSTDQEDEPLP